MRLDITLPDLTPSCCDNLVYAILFDKSQRALKDNGFGVLTLQNYTAAAHADFGIILAEHAERDRYYYLDLLDANFALADNPKGEVYQVEYWRKPVAGVFNRSADELRETRRITVASKQIVDATLSAVGVAELANVQAHVSAVWDSENSILRFMSHLEDDGALVTNSKSVNILVVDNTGAVVQNLNQNTFLTGQAGVFAVNVSNVDLANDQIFMVKGTIIDNANVPHVTVSYLNTWD